jgi:hypothetical protein
MYCSQLYETAKSICDVLELQVALGVFKTSTSTDYTLAIFNDKYQDSGIDIGSISSKYA